jgi:hypothetical protein
MKTQSLAGANLSRAVAVALGYTALAAPFSLGPFGIRGYLSVYVPPGGAGVLAWFPASDGYHFRFDPAAMWELGGPLAHHFKICLRSPLGFTSIEKLVEPDSWEAWRFGAGGCFYGVHPLEAAMRAIVGLKYGEHFPDENL